MKRIHYTKPSITELEILYATDAAANGWGERCYEYIERFERQFAAHLGVSYALATSSCTGALHMGLAALGVGPGDEVILADSNWVATAAPITYLGARPVMVDVLHDTWCIDPDSAERAITPRTKAIIATHLYGNLCDMDRLVAIGRRYHVPIIEDAAEALGSIWHDRRAGSIGLFGTFSFHGSKTITTGEGGMLVTADAALFARVQTLANHGRARSHPRQFWPEVLGFKYKLSNIQAAIGCAQLERIDKLVQRKQSILSSYRRLLAGIEGVSLNPEDRRTTNGAWMPTAVFEPSTGVTREALLAGFASANIDARVFFWPLSSLPMFDSKRENLNAWSIPDRAINLPSYHDMDDTDVERVASVVLEVAKSARGST